MSSSFGSCIIIIIVIIATVNIPAGASNQYKIGDTEGWRLPDEKNTELYKIRASKITFLVGDSIAPPVFLLDKSGFYYFVSSDFDHCRKGQRLMIEVKGQQLPSSMAGRSEGPAIAIIYGRRPFTISTSKHGSTVVDHSILPYPGGFGGFHDHGLLSLLWALFSLDITIALSISSVWVLTTGVEVNLRSPVMELATLFQFFFLSFFFFFLNLSLLSGQIYVQHPLSF